MIRDSRLKTALATFLAAFAVAHLMQFGVSAGLGNLAASSSALTARSVLPPSNEPFAALPSAPVAALAAAKLADTSGLSRAPELLAATPIVGDDLNAFGLPCDRTILAEPVDNAEVRVRISATCDPDTRVEVAHGAVRFTLLTDGFGAAETTIPAMTARADVRARFPDGETLAAYTTVADVSVFDRVALSSEGRSALAIHAFEFGAAHGDAGHVHAGSPRLLSGGVLRRLGDTEANDALIAEVYTFPTGTSLASGTVRLHIEAEVTPANCGRDVAAEAIQAMPGGLPSVVTIRVTVPGCEASGDILVLKNVLRDLRIARN